MSDYLVELGANPNARAVFKTLGLPVQLPQKLARATGPWADRPLEGKVVLYAAASEDDNLDDVVAPILAAAGASPVVLGAVSDDSPWKAAGEAWGRPPRPVAPDADAGKIDALVFDGTGISDVDGLKRLHDVFAPKMKSLRPNGRVLVIGRPPSDAAGVTEAAARRALEGFVRAVARETGMKGITANLVTVAEGREASLAGLLRWVLSPRSAFLTGQPLVLDAPVPADTPDVPFVRSLEGRTILLTGAARGIGAATAKTLAREGATVLCLDRPADLEPLAKVARDIGGVPVGVDITAADAAAQILEIAAEHGGLDGIVHNAGITRDKTLARMDDARWNLTLDVNLRAILETTAVLAEQMNDGGRIVALSSIAGIAGNFGQTNYAASKAGVIGFVSAASARYAERGITVNAVAPGFIETRLTAAIPAATREAGRRLSAVGQGGLPVDIAETVTFLVSPASWGMTGRIVRVCGGSFLGA